jgi:hypothetical protein
MLVCSNSVTTGTTHSPFVKGSIFETIWNRSVNNANQTSPHYLLGASCYKALLNFSIHLVLCFYMSWIEKEPSLSITGLGLPPVARRQTTVTQNFLCGWPLFRVEFHMDNHCCGCDIAYGLLVPISDFVDPVEDNVTTNTKWSSGSCKRIWHVKLQTYLQYIIKEEDPVPSHITIREE